MRGSKLTNLFPLFFWFGFLNPGLTLTARSPVADDALFAIREINVAPTDISLSPSSINENMPAGSQVGTFTTTDPDAGDSFTYTFVTGDGDDNNNSFDISADKLIAPSSFNYEAKSSYSIRVRSTDASNAWTEKIIAITVIDVNEPPVATDVAINPSDQRIGILNTGSFTYTDPDGDVAGTHLYKWYRANNASGSGAVAIAGATSTTYKPVKADGTKYICFEVTPVDIHGLAGTPVKSAYKYINNSPDASNVHIYAPGTLPGQTIHGRFTYFDSEGNPRGNAQYKWYRSNTASPTPSSPGTLLGSTDSTYLLTSNETNKYVWFMVKPVAQSGSTPGDSVWSNVIGPIGSFSASISGSATFCPGTVMPITLSITGGASPYTAVLTRSNSISNKDTTISNITTSPRTINVKISGTYVLKSLTDKESDDATVSATPVVLQFYPKITATFTGTAEICNDGISTATLRINFSAGTAPWTFVVSRFRPNGILINDTTYTNVSFDPYTFTGRVIGTYTSTLYRIKSLTDFNNCPGDTTGTGTERISYRASPTAAIAGIDSICPGDTAYLQVTLTGTAPWSITYRRNGANPTVVNNIPNFNYTLQVYQVGTYTLSRVQDALCTGKTSGQGIVRSHDYPTANISGSATICEYTSANLNIALTGTAPWKFSYRRNAEDPIEIPNLLSSPQTVWVQQDGTYTLYEVYDKNCKGTVSGSATINVTPAPHVTISGLAPAYNKQSTEWVPISGTPSGGTFNGPGVIPYNSLWYFVPSLPPVGTHNIVYAYRASPGSCYGYDTAVVRVLEANATIDFEHGRIKYCRNDRPFIITGANVANAIGSFTISGSVGLVDHHNNTATIYPTQLAVNEYTITYSYFDGTLLLKTAKFDVGNSPTADFKWESECYHAGQSINLKNTSVSTFGNLTDTSYLWKIYTPTGFESYTTRDITHTFPQAGIHKIELQVQTSYGCADTLINFFDLRPTEDLSETYSENFEESPVSWRSGTSSDVTTNSWRLGDPSKGFSGAYLSEKCWYTSITATPAPKEQSWVTSPCFDFTGMDKPMLKLHIWRLFNSNRDGANLQASADSGKTWMLIGQLDDGVKWFNNYNILGKPGDYRVGWSSNSLGENNDTYWVEARHSLDMLKGKTDVQFRIAYGSDFNPQGNNGIAFDDFWIGERNRTALLEHFTNSSDVDCATANTQLNNLANSNELNIIDLQYHTSFPGEDPFNQHNPSVPGARVFYYGLSSVPYTILNGGSKSQYRFDYDVRPLDQNATLIESLLESKFWINLTSKVSDNTLTIEAEITPRQDIPATELTVHLAVIERVITGVTGNNGETSFESVVKTMLPDAAGTTIYQAWNKDESRVIVQSWNMQHVYDRTELRVVAFIQNESTNEVYQAALDTIGVFTGIPDYLPGSHPQKSFIIYPNPAEQMAYIMFDKETGEDITFELYNNVGSLVLIKHIPSGTNTTEIPVDNFPDGLYMLRLVSHDQLIGIGKLTISK